MSSSIKPGVATPLISAGDSVHTPRVLVVDDDPGVLRMIVSVLRRRGYTLAEARNGKEALQIMTEGGVSLVLLDLMMPIMNGWDVLRVRAADPELQKIPIIVITANIGPDTKEILGSGICALLPKPFDLTNLAEMVSSCLALPPPPPSAAPAVPA